MGNKELFAIVKGLNLPKGKYALFGSAPLGIRGLRECHDIDIIVTQELWNQYRYKPEWKLKKITGGGNDFEGLRNDNIELWKDWWPGWDIKKLIQEAEIIEGLPFVRMGQVLKWKKFIARKKDLEDVELIENYLKNSNYLETYLET